MRMLALAFLLLPLAACNGFGPKPATGPVDAVHLSPMSGQEQALMVSADSAAAGGDSDRAERSYLDAVARSQGHVEAHLALANLYLRQGRMQNAGEILGKAAQLQPNNPQVAHLLGKILIGQNQPGEALAAYNRGLVAAPNDLDLLNGAGVASDMLHRHRAAQVYYQRALAAWPATAQPTTKTNYAMSLILDGQSKAAIALLKDEVKKPHRHAAAARQPRARLRARRPQRRSAQAHRRPHERGRANRLARPRPRLHDGRADGAAGAPTRRPAAQTAPAAGHAAVRV